MVDVTKFSLDPVGEDGAASATTCERCLGTGMWTWIDGEERRSAECEDCDGTGKDALRVAAGRCPVGGVHRWQYYRESGETSCVNCDYVL